MGVPEADKGDFKGRRLSVPLPARTGRDSGFGVLAEDAFTRVSVAGSTMLLTVLGRKSDTIKSVILWREKEREKEQKFPNFKLRVPILFNDAFWQVQKQPS